MGQEQRPRRGGPARFLFGNMEPTTRRRVGSAGNRHLGRDRERVALRWSARQRGRRHFVTGGTVDRVNYQLDKLDTVTDSAVAMADSADTAVRAVSTAIAKPVEKVSGLAAGIAHGVSSLRKTRSVSEAMDAA